MHAKITTLVVAGARTQMPTWLMFVFGSVMVGVSLAGYMGKVPVQGPRWFAPTGGLAMGVFLLGLAVARATGHLH